MDSRERLVTEPPVVYFTWVQLVDCAANGHFSFKCKRIGQWKDAGMSQRYCNFTQGSFPSLVTSIQNLLGWEPAIGGTISFGEGHHVQWISASGTQVWLSKVFEFLKSSKIPLIDEALVPLVVSRITPFGPSELGSKRWVAGHTWNLDIWLFLLAKQPKTGWKVKWVIHPYSKGIWPHTDTVWKEEF